MRIRHLLVALVLSIATGATAIAAAPDHWVVDIKIQNVSDAWAWVTVYSGAGRGIMTAGCVDPRSEHTFWIDTQTFNPSSPITMPYEVRAEITHAGCNKPVYVDKTLGWARGMPYFVRGERGNYSFWHTR